MKKMNSIEQKGEIFMDEKCIEKHYSAQIWYEFSLSTTNQLTNLSSFSFLLNNLIYLSAMLGHSIYLSASII